MQPLDCHKEGGSAWEDKRFSPRPRPRISPFSTAQNAGPCLRQNIRATTRWMRLGIGGVGTGWMGGLSDDDASRVQQAPFGVGVEEWSRRAVCRWVGGAALRGTCLALHDDGDPHCRLFGLPVVCSASGCSQAARWWSATQKAIFISAEMDACRPFALSVDDMLMNRFVSLLAVFISRLSRSRRSQIMFKTAPCYFEFPFR